MKIHLAKSAGFCSGVKRAVRLALETAKNEHAPVYMLGDIVHNEHVVRELDQAGIQVVDSLDQLESGGVLLIRAHGAVPAIYETARQKDLNIVDVTCPLVLEIHKLARQLHEQAYTVVVIGDHGHDEVIGIAGQIKSAIVIDSPEEAHKVFERCSRLGIVVQSTQNIGNVQKILAILAPKCREIKFFNTICAPTTRHQQDIRRLPKENDVMIIIGSFTSANTCRLTTISKELNPKTYQVESAQDVKPEWFHGANSVGVSAGASTPDTIIRQVIARIQNITED